MRSFRELLEAKLDPQVTALKPVAQGERHFLNKHTIRDAYKKVRAFNKTNNVLDQDKKTKTFDRSTNRFGYDLVQSIKKYDESEEMNELSKNALTSYVKKASADLTNRYNRLETASGSPKIAKRSKFITNATRKAHPPVDNYHDEDTDLKVKKKLTEYVTLDDRLKNAHKKAKLRHFFDRKGNWIGSSSSYKSNKDAIMNLMRNAAHKIKGSPFIVKEDEIKFKKGKRAHADLKSPSGAGYVGEIDDFDNEHVHLKVPANNPNFPDRRMKAHKSKVTMESILEKHLGFKKLEGKLENKGYSKNSADKIAASIGRKKYGKKKFANMAHESIRLTEGQRLTKDSKQFIAHHVNRYHVSMSDQDVNDDMNKFLKPDAPDVLKKQAIAHALKTHKKNQKLYTAVMSGNFKEALNLTENEHEKIPNEYIKHEVGKYDADTPDDKLIKDIMLAIKKSRSGWDDKLTKDALSYALKVHNDNRKMKAALKGKVAESENKEAKKTKLPRYDAVAVQKEINKDKRISKKEARMIHAVLRGWRESEELTEAKIQEVINEVLTKKATAKDLIDDFQNSDNPRFAGKSKEKRRQMAIAAYYAKQGE